ncbi:TonB-dependent receptor domain-containing protein [Flexithrix dorotheae]|uniref:TonB-dependent receptor domain-containing protein n=1 Tax=Flexithrix dorotheae TaxID=70993 RepID=UPI000360B04E|nr:TonB-dependent receptor [Flexithrix dorotheae]
MIRYLLITIGLLYGLGAYLPVFSQENTNASEIIVNKDYMSKSIRAMLEDLKKSYNFQLDYDPKLPILTSKISTKFFRNKSLEETMEMLLSGTDLHFKIVDEKVIIREENEKIITKFDFIPTQFNFNLSGLVKADESGESLPFATVVIKSTGKGSTTNLDGFFTLFNVPSDTSTLLISYLGYQTQELKLTPELMKSELSISLNSIVNELNEVVVSAVGEENMMKASENISQVSISPAQIAALPSLGEKDIFRSLQLLPGVSGTNETSSGLYVRGGTPDQNLVLFDGFTVYHVDHFYGFFSAFNANAIKDVQLYKGGFESKFGGRTSSVVELTGKQGNARQVSGNLGLSSLSANASLEVPLGKKATFLLAGRRSYTDIIQSGLYNDVFALFNETGNNQQQQAQIPQGPGGGGGGRFGGRNFQQNTTEPSFYFYDLNTKLTLKPTNKDIISFSFYNGQDKLDNSRETENTFSRNDEDRTIYNNTIDKLDWGNWGSSAKWGRQWSPRFYSNVVVAYSNYFSNRNRITDIETVIEDSVTRRSSGTIEDNDLKDYTIRLDNEYLLNENNKIEFGAQLTNNAIDYKYTLNDSLNVLDRADQGNVGALYLQDTWDITQKLQLKAGLRASYYDITEEFYLEPRASMQYKLSDKIKLKAAWGKYYQFVNRIIREDVSQGSRDFWLLANDETNPVSSAMHYIAGVSYETNNFLFDVEIFQKDMTGLSEFTLRFAGPRQAEAYEQLFYEGTGIARGAEFLIQKKVGNYTGWIGYTLSEVVHEFPELSQNPFYALHDQRHEGKIVNSLKLGKWTLSGNWVYGTGKPYTAPYGEYELTLLDGTSNNFVSVGSKNAFRLPDYHRLDLSMSVDLHLSQRTKLNTGISMFNVYNRKNIWYKEFEVSEDEVITTDVTLIGITPTLFLNLSF